MLLGSVLLVLAVLSLAVALTASVFDLVAGGDPIKRRIAVRGTATGMGFLTLALVLLAAAFLVGDHSIRYVWANSDLRYAWYQRLSGLWVGRAGSLMLWTTFTLGIWCLEELRHVLVHRRDATMAAETAETANGPRNGAHRATQDDIDTRLGRTERVRRVARTTLLGITGLMTLVVLLYDPFVPISQAEWASEPWGRGVNPQLIILLNAIHPPLVFIGYALTSVVSAFALGHLVTGEKAWLGPARRWAHIAFLFLTIGVGLGALWAYIALGWGGYWAWDPVEVGSVIPWLLIVLFLHAAYRADGKGEFPVAAPAFGLLAFPAALFSAIVVRAGGVWVSLHSFLAPGSSTDPWERFVNALANEPEVQLYTGLLLLAIIGTIGLVAWHIRRLEHAGETPGRRPLREPSPDETLPQRLLSYVTLGNVFVVGVMLIALLTTVTITVLFVGVNGFPSDRAREQIFTMRTAPIALTMVLVMALAISIGVLRKTRVLALLGGALVIGAIAAFLVRDIPGGSSTLGIDVWPLAMATPVLVVSAVLVAYRIVVAWKTMRRRQAIRTTGVHMVHLGIALLFLGHGFVSTFETMDPPVEFSIGDSKEIGPYVMRLEELRSTDTDGNGRLDNVVAVFRVWDADRDVGLVTTGFQYYDFQSHYKPTVGLGKVFTKDVYLAPSAIHDPNQGWLLGNLPLWETGNLEASEVDGIAIQVWTLPFVDLVWTGASLMVFGALILCWSSWTAWRPDRVPERRPDAAAIGA